MVRQLFQISALNFALTKNARHEQANFVESPITRMFGGKFRSLLHTPNKPDIITTEDWRSLHLDVLVRVSSFLLVPSAWMSC